MSAKSTRKPTTNGLEFWSDDHRFGLRIFNREVSELLRICADSGSMEAGGILVGFYTARHDCAVVRAISGPPSDSQRGRTWFHRGVHGLQEWLDRYWYVSRHYYLGEWHFHSHGSPLPSQSDVWQLKCIANSALYKCPEPVLLITGGDPLVGWTAGAYVFPRGEKPIQLSMVTASLDHIEQRFVRRESAVTP